MSGDKQVVRIESEMFYCGLACDDNSDYTQCSTGEICYGTNYETGITLSYVLYKVIVCVCQLTDTVVLLLVFFEITILTGLFNYFHH